MKKKLLIFTLLGIMIGAVSTAGAATLVYSNSTDLGAHTTDPVTFNLTGLIPHSAVMIQFDLFIYDSWDGNTTAGGTVPPDYFGVSVDGTTQSWTFDNFNYSDETNTDVADFVGNFNSVNSWGPIDRHFIDYNGGLSFAHSLETMTLSFMGFGAGFQGIDDESWRVENIKVYVNSGASPVPEPSTMILLAMGLLGLTGVATRRKK